VRISAGAHRAIAQRQRQHAPASGSMDSINQQHGMALACINISENGAAASASA